MKFNESTFSPNVLSGIEKAGFTECTPVQERVFHTAIDSKKDVMVQSQTGSGKTAAFLLTVFELIEREKDTPHKALIIAPTRELAVQIEQEAVLLGSFMENRVVCLYGGTGYKQQQQKLANDPNIIIGTPGRLLDFASQGKVSLIDVDMLVIDEADRMFDMGFYPDLKKILRRTSKNRVRQTMLFSATLNTRVTRLAWEFMNNAEEIVINPEGLTVKEINQVLYHVTTAEKMSLLLGILRSEKPRSVLIFTNTKDMAVRVATRLSANDFHAEYIMGDLPQKKRLRLIQNIKAGRIDILVATDVAARGLHIDDLEMVINYDVPEDPENYVHRIGRTARAGKSGKAVTMACERFVYGLEPIEQLIDMKIPFVHPDEELLDQEDKSAHMKHAPSRRTSGDTKSGRRRSGKRSSGDSSQRRSTAAKSGSKRKSDRSAAPSKSFGSDKSAGPADRTESSAPAQSARSAGSAGSADSKPSSERNRQRSGRKKARNGISAAAEKTAAHGKPDTAAKPSRDTSLDSRLEYYRKKYGEDFKLKD